MCTRCSVAGSSQLPDSWEETARDERERARWEATFGVVKQLSSLVSDFGSLLERRLNSDLPIEIREQLRQLNHGVDTLSSLAPRPTSTSSMQVDHPPELDNDLPADLAVVDEAAQAAVAAVEEVAVAEEAVTEEGGGGEGSGEDPHISEVGSMSPVSSLDSTSVPLLPTPAQAPQVPSVDQGGSQPIEDGAPPPTSNPSNGQTLHLANDTNNFIFTVQACSFKQTLHLEPFPLAC